MSLQAVKDIEFQGDECSIVYTDLSRKELYRQVVRMVTPGSLGGGMVSTLAWNARDVGSILAPRAIFPSTTYDNMHTYEHICMHNIYI